MTNRATLKALLARVLEGTGPDRELDFEIAAAFGWPDSPNLHQHARRYTESLDAALKLVPKGWSWHVALRFWPAPTRATGSVWSESIDGSKLFYVDATTPARALIAACLKARMEAQPLSNP